LNKPPAGQSSGKPPGESGGNPTREPEPTGESTGTITFLFTDIQGSTAMWERDAKGMQDTLARHDEILATYGVNGRIELETGSTWHNR